MSNATRLAYHPAWTAEEIAFAAQCWRQSMTQDAMAEALSDRFGVVMSRKSVARVIGNNPDQFPARKPVKRQAKPIKPPVISSARQALLDRCAKIVELWGDNIAVPIIADRAGCSVNYVSQFVRENTDRCPPRVVENLSKGFQPCRALSEFGVGKKHEWVSPQGSSNSMEVPAKLPVSVAAFSWDART